MATRRQSSHYPNTPGHRGGVVTPGDRGRLGRRKLATIPWCLRRSKVFFLLVLAFCLAVVFISTVEINRMSSGDAAAKGGGGRFEGRKPPPGSAVRYRPVDLVNRLEEGRVRLDRERSEARVRIRQPRIALVTGRMGEDPQTLMLLTLLKGLRELGYTFMVYALEVGKANSLWEHIGSHVSVLGSESIDWSNYEGVILSSLEARRVVPSLMKHPFVSIPLVWFIQEDILGRRLPSYEAQGWKDLLTMWRSAFSRANVVVFQDFSLPMMYSSLDTGNFYVVPGSPVNVWEVESYTKSHSRTQLRKDNGFNDGDLIILVIGNSFFYDELPWEYAAIMNALIPETKKITRMQGFEGTVKFVFLCGDSSVAHGSTFQELASHLGFPSDSVKHYGVDRDVNGVLLMADLVLYGSFQEEQNFPPLLLRAMSFEIPIIVPNLDIITKYVMDEVHGLIFHPHALDTLATAFSALIEDNTLSNLAYTVASCGKSLSRNILALDCTTEYAKLLESVLQFPSDAMLPLSVSHIKQNTWAWDLFEMETQHTKPQFHDGIRPRRNIIDALEEQVISGSQFQDASEVNDSLQKDFPTQIDWDILNDMELLEESDQREREEIAERGARNLGEWDAVYNNARKADKNTNFEKNERDETELEKIGLQLCIYEIYSGQGAWPFLQNGSLYRGISLYKGAQRPSSDDVDAVGRLPILNDAYYRDLLCEFGAIFSIANKVDSIHSMPWIGFQSWHAVGRKVSLSNSAEEVLERTAQEKSKGDVVYYWALMDMNQKDKEIDEIDFWSMCDILNAGHCSTVFEDAFRLMYGLPNNTAALPPMPDDGDQWSSLHSWMMPTSSFLEFVMFSRIFVDSVNSLNQTNSTCILGSSELEKRHCYCRMLEMLVNVWAYHSARKMVYLDPVTGQMLEQHPVEQRTGQMWAKYFSSTLLKSMDEELAEEADDEMHPTNKWLWPLTGEVHWLGVFDKEREDKYRHKLDKKRKNKEKLLDRQKFGYRQKSLGKNQ